MSTPPASATAWAQICFASRLGLEARATRRRGYATERIWRCDAVARTTAPTTYGPCASASRPHARHLHPAEVTMHPATCGLSPVTARTARGATVRGDTRAACGTGVSRVAVGARWRAVMHSSSSRSSACGLRVVCAGRRCGGDASADAASSPSLRPHGRRSASASLRDSGWKPELRGRWGTRKRRGGGARWGAVHALLLVA